MTARSHTRLKRLARSRNRRLVHVRRQKRERAERRRAKAFAR